MIEMIFDVCVEALVLLAGWLGISYQAINVWIFVVIWPIFTLGLAVILIWQWRAIRRLRRQLTAPQPARS